ncbi:MAG TPA: VOC family protein [Myxococcota bacterium]|nr:VOC family protein [Myxococcota bacterium]
MAIAGVSHLGLCVSDLPRALAFWRDALGFREGKRLDVSGELAETLLGLHDLDLRAVLLEREGVRLELLHYAAPGHRGAGEPRPMNALGFTHLSLRVADLDAALAAVEAAGGRVLRATRVREAQSGRGAVFVTDPDGTRVELVDAGAPSPGV